MHLLVSLLGAGILIGLGVAKARPTSGPAGWLFVAAGAAIALTACCTTGLFMGADQTPSPVIAYQLSTVVGAGGDFVAMVVVAAGFVVLSRAR
jgi:hypothetical protein